MAADMPIKAPPPPPVAYYDWSGAYIGFNAGGVWNEVNRTFKVGGAVNPNFGTNDSDGIFGFHAGAQWQWGAWVLGVEAALSGCFKECVSHDGHPSGRRGLRSQHLRSAQAHQPVHGRSAAGLCLGSVDDLRDRRLGFGQPQGNVLLDRHRRLRRSRFLCQRCIAQRRLVCRRRLRLHGPQGPAGRRDPRPRISTLRRQRQDGVLRHGLQPVTIADYDLNAKGDIVRARLTIKTQGYGFFYR